jgi:hypothetical protein
MRQHMPARFWPQLPESALIPDLLAKAQPRVSAMIDPAAQINDRIAATLHARGDTRITLPVLAEATINEDRAGPHGGLAGRLIAGLDRRRQPEHVADELFVVGHLGDDDLCLAQ